MRRNERGSSRRRRRRPIRSRLRELSDSPRVRSGVGWQLGGGGLRPV